MKLAILLGEHLNQPASGSLRVTPEAVYRFPYSQEERRQIAARAETFQGRQFDSEFDITHNDRVYCSELVYLCINQTFQKEILKPELSGDRQQITIDDLYLKTNTNLILKSDRTRIINKRR